MIAPYLSVFGPNAGKYGPEKTPYLDTCHALGVFLSSSHFHAYVFISFDFCLSFASVEALPQSPGFCVAYQFIYLVVLHIVFKAV